MSFFLPPIYLLNTHFERHPHELHKLEKEIGVVWDINEAELVIGRVNTKTRAKHELRKLGLHTEDEDEMVEVRENDGISSEEPARKRRKLESSIVNGKEVISLGSETESDMDVDDARLSRGCKHVNSKQTATAQENKPPLSSGVNKRTQVEAHSKGKSIKVLKLAWYYDSLQAGNLQPFEKYLIYEGRILAQTKTKLSPKATKLPPRGLDILTRAKADPLPPQNQRSIHGHRSQGSGGKQARPSSQLVQLHHETTFEHEGRSQLPPIPDYLHTIYSCQRPTPLNCPNGDFLAQLRTIKKARVLKGDEIGVRAYSAAIATIAAYPYTLTSSYEVTRLPNCGDKFAAIWRDWKDRGVTEEVEEFENSGEMQSLSLFYGIHDVGDVTARKFYGYGWRDLDDVVEHGWNTLTRSQQIGLKYYDEFALRIPRPEAEHISSTILSHANSLFPGFQMVIVGGYRRGKPDCGDVDVVLSHPNEEVTDQFLSDLCLSLEDANYITHRLTFSIANSSRGQGAVSWKGGVKGHSGFDTLDHAFVVWQDPVFYSSTSLSTSTPTTTIDIRERKELKEEKNPHPHRRVDIIISPWKTAGCAVLGWSGGTMFERDLRRYCRKERGLKFDSSGVRRLSDGVWVDLEGVGEGDGEMGLVEKEKRVFRGLGLEWREGEERCTD